VDGSWDKRVFWRCQDKSQTNARAACLPADEWFDVAKAGVPQSVGREHDAGPSVMARCALAAKLNGTISRAWRSIAVDSCRRVREKCGACRDRGANQLGVKARSLNGHSGRQVEHNATFV
jgi:hypothetical protein